MGPVTEHDVVHPAHSVALAPHANAKDQMRMVRSMKLGVCDPAKRIKRTGFAWEEQTWGVGWWPVSKRGGAF